MKYSIAYTVIGVLVGIFVARSAIAQSRGESEVPRTISYQGMVSSATGAQLPSGDYAVTVRLYADEDGREVLWEGEYRTRVENGLLNLELGSGDYPLPGSSAMDRSLWIGIQVGEGPEMTPRTRLSAVPYALTVPDGSVTFDKLGVDYVSSIMIDGEKVTRKGSSLNITGGEGVDLRYDRLRGSMQIDLRRSGEDQGTKGDGEEGRSTQAANSTVYWSETGNNSTTPGTNYVGTSDAVELEIHVNSGNTTANAGDKRVMLYDPQPNSPNLIGGYQGNLPDTGSTIEGATIGGGGRNNRVNEVKDDYGTIGGGAGNIAGGLDTTSRTDDIYATVGGGRKNEAQAEYSTVGGGRENEAQAEYSTVGGGGGNYAQGGSSTVGGGVYNEAQANYSTVGGGYQNEAQAYYSTVGGGDSNKAQEYYSTVGGGYQNEAQEYSSTVGGGYQNEAQAEYSTVGGGRENEAQEQYSTVGGGYQNEAQEQYSTVGGGYQNEAQEQYSTVGGGRLNQAQEYYSTVGGGRLNQAQASYSTVGGGYYNQAQASYTTVGGGYWNEAQASYSTVGGGYWNEAQASYSTVGGGYYNQAQGYMSTVGGGRENEAQGSYSTVGGGRNNQAATASAIPGGRYLTVGDNSFGYNGYNGDSTTQTDISAHNQTAYFGDVDLWIGNVDRVPRELRFYVGNNGNFTYSGTTAPLYVGFKAPQSLASTRTTSTLYTLPTDFPSANGALLSSSTTGTLSWSTPSQDWSLTGNSGTTPLSSGTGHYLGTSDTTDLVIATSGTERIGIASTGEVTVAEGLTVSGNVDAQSGLDVTGSDLTVGGTKFTVSDATGNTAIDGTLAVDGATTLSGNVDAQSGLDVTGSDLTVGGTKFTVSDATGNTDIDGTLTVDSGATVTAGGLEVSAGGAAITGNSSVTGAFNLANTASALLLNNSAGTSGQVLVSKGGDATPEWGDISSAAWDLSGNEATTPGTGEGENYLGTTDRKDLVIATNAIEAIRIGNSASAAGSVTIANGLTVSAGGASVTGDFELAGDLEVSEDVLVKGDLEVSEDVLVKKDLEVLEDVSVRGSFNLAETASALLLNNSAGTSGQVLVSRGGGATPEWGDMSSASAAWDLSGNEATTPGTGEGENYLGTSDTTDLVIATSGTERIEIASTGEVTVAEGLTVSGNLDATNGLDVTGEDLTVGTNFTVDDATGNTAIDGTLAVDGNTTLGDDNTADAVTVNGRLSQTGTQQVRFAGNVDATNGLDVTGADLTVGGTNFTVDEATGNTSIGGTLTVDTVDGDVTFNGNVDATNGLDVTGADLRVGGTKFTVAQATGNTAIDGTLAVDGNTTLGDDNTADAVTVNGGLSQTGTQQVRFAGNVDAQSGLDVTGSDLTVGGTKFTVAQATGNTDIDGTLTVDGGATVTAGGLEVSAGGAAITGNSSVTGSFNLAGTASALLLNNSGGTSGQVLVSKGGGATPEWGDMSSAAWDLSGNSGTRPGTNYVGTSDAEELEIHVNSGNTSTTAGDRRVMLYDPQPSSPNLIGGYQGNLPGRGTAIEGVTIGGGGRNNGVNAVKDNYGTIGGGAGNVAGGLGTTSTTDDRFATVGGGYFNEAQAWSSTVGGGYFNEAQASSSTVGGGYFNEAQASSSTVGGGRENEAQAIYSTVGGGRLNEAQEDYSTVGGGRENESQAIYSTVGGGRLNEAQEDYSTVGGGRENESQAIYSTVGGGYKNEAQGTASAIPGGSYLHLGAYSFGYNGYNVTSSPSTTDLSSLSNIAYLGNVDLWIGNVDNTPRQLRFYVGNNGNFTYSGSTAPLYVGFKAPQALASTRTTSTLYTLPTDFPSANGALLSSSTTGTLSWSTPSQDWALTGNGGTTPGTNYVGTSDATDLVIATSGTERIRVDTNGSVGIGTNAPDVSLDVDGGLAIRPPAEIEITSDNTTVTPGDRSSLRIDSDGNPANRTITLAAGEEGQILVIQCTATGTNGIELLTSASTHTFTANKTLQGKDNLFLMWDEDNEYWLEIGHTDF